MRHTQSRPHLRVGLNYGSIARSTERVNGDMVARRSKAERSGPCKAEARPAAKRATYGTAFDHRRMRKRGKSGALLPRADLGPIFTARACFRPHQRYAGPNRPDAVERQDSD